MDADYWEALKAKYDYRCAASAGSREGRTTPLLETNLTKLQKGHKDTCWPLGPGNIIPQCSKCNQPDLNCGLYDDKGRVVGLANAIVVQRCPADLQKEIYIRLNRQFGGKDPEGPVIFLLQRKASPRGWLSFIGKQGKPCYKFDERR